MTINGKYYGEIYGETFVGQNIWAPYMTQILAGTPVENVSSANIGSSTSRSTQPRLRPAATDMTPTLTDTAASFSRRGLGVLRTAGAVIGGLGLAGIAAGGAALAWGSIERTMPTLRRYDVPIERDVPEVTFSRSLTSISSPVRSSCSTSSPMSLPPSASTWSWRRATTSGRLTLSTW